MANSFTGIYADTLTAKSFDSAQYDGLAITAGIPVRLYYRVLPGQQIAFGNGSSSLGGVRTAKIMQLKPMNNASTAAYIDCSYRLMYVDANKVRTTVLKQDECSNCNTAPTSYSSDVAAQAAFLPETVGMNVGAYAYLCIEFTPKTTDSTNKWEIDNTVIQLPITVYTLANAAGQ